MSSKFQGSCFIIKGCKKGGILSNKTLLGLISALFTTRLQVSGREYLLKRESKPR